MASSMASSVSENKVSNSFPRCNLLLDKLTTEPLREKNQAGLFRTITLPRAESISSFILILNQIDCIEYVELKEFDKIVVWINIETEFSKDTRPFYIKTGIFAHNKITSYPVSLIKANEFMRDGIFNVYEKISKIELIHYNLTYNNKLYVPYLISLSF
jgi:hypothetical protein